MKRSALAMQKMLMARISEDRRSTTFLGGVLAKIDMDIEPGDPVELIAVGGERVPVARVVSVQAVGGVLDAERERLKELNLLPRVQGFLKEASN